MLGGSIVLCHDISGLIKGLKQEHNPTDLRVYIESSQRSLKAVFLHNGIPNAPFRLFTLYTERKLVIT